MPSMNKPFDPDRCFDCDQTFTWAAGKRAFYTVVINCHIKRCCPKCFPKHEGRWMG